MKFIGKTGSGKTEFVSAFIEFLLNDIKNIDNVYLLSPTHDQNGWDRIRKSITHITDINEIVDCKNSVIVCDDMQTQLKGNKILTEMIFNKRHRRLSIIQCKQYTQTIDLVQKMNADYFILLGTFTLGDCRYFTEIFLSSISARVLYETIKYMNKNDLRFLWTDCEERICLGFKTQVMLMNMSRNNTFLVKDCLSE